MGLGASYPRFKIDNAAKIATGFGGVLYMILGVFTLIAVITAAAVPTMTVVRWLEHGTQPGTARLVGSAIAGFVALVGPVLDFVQAYEHCRWGDCGRLGRELALEDTKATSIYRDSVAWAMTSFGERS